jgi:transposase
VEALYLGTRMESMGRNQKYPREVKERAVRMLLEWRATRNTTVGGVDEIAEKIGVHPETLRNWVKQHRIDAGEKPGVTTDDKARIVELEREVRELRRANEILKAASAFFARELDPRPPK